MRGEACSSRTIARSPTSIRTPWCDQQLQEVAADLAARIKSMVSSMETSEEQAFHSSVARTFQTIDIYHLEVVSTLSRPAVSHHILDNE